MSTTNGTTARQPLSVCVFCGASPGSNPLYISTAQSLARVFADENWSLVYGGGTVGLMGALASSLVELAGSQRVHGIIPKALIQHERHGRVPDEAQFGRTTVVRDMHERKAMMGRAANAFVALPGGFGTMEELFEIVTWNQLGIHDCPIVVLNINGFYDGLLGWVRSAVEAGFIKENSASIISEAKTVDEVAEKIRTYRPASGRFDLDWKSEGEQPSVET